VDEMAFYGSKEISFYTDAESFEALTWNEKWNVGYRPVVWGCTLSEDNAYVVSVTVTDGTFENLEAIGGLTGPTRAGYVFAGWSMNAQTDENQTGEITAAELAGVAKGTTVYAYWNPFVETQPQEPAPDAEEQA
jgi:uncharacterized repeat protein (TIGR02543 family)